MEGQPRLQVGGLLPSDDRAAVLAVNLGGKGAIGGVECEAEPPLPGAQQKGGAGGPAARSAIGVGLEGERREVGFGERLRRCALCTGGEQSGGNRSGGQELAQGMPHGQAAGSKLMVVTSPLGPEAPMGQKAARTLAADRKLEKLISNLATRRS